MTEASEDRLMRMEFGGADLPLVRSLVAESAIGAGLAGSAGGAFVQATLEIAVNAVVHGGGRGTIELRLVDGELRCEVADEGPGLPEQATPEGDGQGLRLAEALTGRLELHSGPGRRGTTAALAVRVPVAAN
ncbi:ATP-binding protein [Streptomyces fulvoviolaceus]|uniref:ATP-binding protein n=1 Tax=Streptomyces fulvoviolaceus TaxID=285535 RepID=UPI000997CF5C|nr:ATP-binding protein [Streptomyces fulvoviolaceus]MCT9083165.1 ATP-binding protein [Streptomyces fulvoviolaceus]